LQFFVTSLVACTLSSHKDLPKMGRTVAEFNFLLDTVSEAARHLNSTVGHGRSAA